VLEAVAYRITGDRELSCDIIQDAYVSVLTGRTKFEGRSSLKTYLYRMVINSCIDARKRRSRWSAIQEKLGLMQRAQPQNCYEIKELTRKIFAGISPEYSVPLTLSEVDGMSYREIADILQVSLDAVRTRIFRCREKLKKELLRVGYPL
jgi:RNA polymerase sigma-70 factor (ECF subfamily)